MDQPQQLSKELPAFESVVEAIFELEIFVDLSWAGMDYAELATQIASVVKRTTARAGVAMTQEERLERAKRLESFATAQRPGGFPYLYQLAVTRLWSILEAHVQEVFVTVTLSNPEVRNLPGIKKLKGPLVDFADIPRERQAEFLFGALLEELGAPLKRGVGRFEAVFDAIGLGGPIDENVRRLLLEVSEIRNAVVHRRGTADKRLVAACPWSGFKAGESIKILPPQFEAYIFAAYWYTIEISRRVLTRYPPPDIHLYDSEQRLLDVQRAIATMFTRPS